MASVVSSSDPYAIPRSAAHRTRGGSGAASDPTIDRHLPKRIRPAWRVVRRTITNFVDEEGLQWSGAVAFYLVLSVPPLLIAAVSIGVVVVGAESARSFLVDQVARFLPGQQGVIEEIVGQTVDASGAAVAAAIGFLLFSGSRVFASLITAINLMWHEIEPPGFWKRQLERIVMVLTIGALLALAGVADVVFAFAGELLNLPVSVRVLAQSQVVPVLFIGTALFLLFYLIPRRAATWQTALIGAAVGAVALRVAQVGFTDLRPDVRWVRLRLRADRRAWPPCSPGRWSPRR